MPKNKPLLFIVCTGLGYITRGFETYISSLASHLSKAENFSHNIEVLAGKNYDTKDYTVIPIFSIKRNNRIVQYFLSKWDFLIEQISFFIFSVPYIVYKKPSCIYLGEYDLYCYFYKLRKYLKLNFSLVLYTGGQAIPGLYDSKRDFVHHITDRYVNELNSTGYPLTHQFIIPHFIGIKNSYNIDLITQIKNKAKSKKIILSVGILDDTTKKMGLLIDILQKFKNVVFPIFLGESSIETTQIQLKLKEYFGEGNYYLGKVTQNELGSYYTAADLFVLLSEKESFGLVFIEAMFFGRNVICRKFHETEFVLKNNAKYLENGSISQQQNNFDSLINHETLLNSKELSDYAINNFSWEALEKKYIDMFNYIANTSKTLI